MAIIKHRVKDMTRQEWLEFRQQGLGGSDIGTLMGLNEYSSATHLFLVKAGIYELDREDTLAAYMGRRMEDHVADLWKYWNLTPESVMENDNAGNVIRKSHRTSFAFQNDKFPWLLGNFDRIIPKNQVWPFTGEVRDTEGVLEIKTSMSYANDKWESGVHPYYLTQILTYITILGVPYGEIALFKNGRILEVIPVELDDDNRGIQEAIIEKSRIFWDKILQAREIVAQRDFMPVDEFTQAIGELEPSPEEDNADALKTFLKERYRNQESQVMLKGDEEDYKMAMKYIECNDKIKELDSKKTRLSNLFINKIKDAEGINLGAAGTVTYKPNKNGNRSLRVNVK